MVFFDILEEDGMHKVIALLLSLKNNIRLLSNYMRILGVMGHLAEVAKEHTLIF